MTTILMLMKSEATCWPPTSQSPEMTTPLWPARDLQMMTLMVMVMIMMVMVMMMMIVMVMASQRPTESQRQEMMPIVFETENGFFLNLTF